jgi:hypothetical protein
MKPIFGLTLHRPWSWAMVHGSKRIENRSWPPPADLIGGYIALHAGKTWDYEGAAKVITVHPEMPRSAGEHPLGVIGVARLAGVVQDAGEVTAEQQRWFFGEFGWVLADVVALPKPVPCRGFQGLWPLPVDVLARVRAKYSEARRVG